MNGRRGPRRAGWAAVMAAVAVLSVGCGGGGDDEATPPPTIAEPTTPTTTDPYAVPAVIDAAYVNRVLEGIDAAVGEIVRIVFRTRDIPPEVGDRIKAVFLTRDDQNLELQSLQHSLRQQFSGYRPEPGNKRSVVKDLISASRECIFVKVERDYSAVGSSPNMELSMEWIVLKPGNVTQTEAQYNPTPWKIASNGVAPPSEEPCKGA